MRRRRARLGFVASAVVSMMIVGAWFPLSELSHQRQQLTSVASRLERLQTQDRALAKEEARLKSPAEIARIAREQYQLVSPGNTPYQVLPQSGSSSSPQTVVPTDPGLAKPVAPSGNVELPPGALATHRGATRNGTPSTFVGRMLHTLEFWR